MAIAEKMTNEVTTVDELINMDGEKKASKTPSKGLAIHKGKSKHPRRCLCYGDPGIGKSTYAAKLNKPFFINLNKGIGDLEVDSWGEPIETFAKLQNVLEFFHKEDHEYKTLVIDTISEVEAMIWREVAIDRDEASIADINFHEGYVLALSYWKRLTNALDAIREKGVMIFLIDHVTTRKPKNPRGETYDEYCPKIHKLAGEQVIGWCDEVLFFTTKLYTKTNAKDKKTIAIGGEERMVYTTKKAGHLAKNRLKMSDEITMDPAEYANYIKQSK